MSLSDTRFILLSKWLSQHFNTDITPTLICGDASFRRYFRVQHLANTYIVSDSPIELVPIAPFIELAAAYAQLGLKVPEVIAQDDINGFVLQSDLGDEQLITRLNDQSVIDFYQQALGLLPQVAQVKSTIKGDLPQYDAAFVQRELAIFTEWLLLKHLQLTLSEDEHGIIENAFGVLTANAIEQPSVGMHRDFHCRNILINQQQLALIDFQDAVIGPVTYDAVSLLRDCYVRWPDAVVNQLQMGHFNLCIQHGLIDDGVSFSQYQRWFDLMGMQRHIKAAGIFVRLNLRDGKAGYLKDIPLTLSYIVDIAALYPELQDFGQWLQQKVLTHFTADATDQ
ncbi:aminoglycoside phosphotransferase family protein [Shewanella sp. 4_MG-2023]|uniref:aminoglycoside phosphotransferase family protein n=1 Tax=Shewanella sp. 4_MG-2023 TaxID=3062652 RepID=UPI0026E130DE|nr:phosphotransferase [Shewanella sp. 4_MG-2023]MDO6677238.1 phosphotransferase [Shewanella sp. 4_MG-2023]